MQCKNSSYLGLTRLLLAIIVVRAFLNKGSLPTVNEAGSIKHKSQYPHGYLEQSDKIIQNKIQ